MSQILVKIWPWGLGHRWTPLGGHYVPLETVTNSSNRITVSCKVTEICQIMCFWHLVKFQSQTQCSCSQALKPFLFLSCSQNSKHFDSMSRNAQDIDNWNFATCALCHDFIGQGQGHGHHFDFFIVHPSSTKYQNSFAAPWADFVTNMHTYTRAHHPITARAINSTRCKNYEVLGKLW